MAIQSSQNLPSFQRIFDAISARVDLEEHSIGCFHDDVTRTTWLVDGPSVQVAASSPGRYDLASVESRDATNLLFRNIAEIANHAEYEPGWSTTGLTVTLRWQGTDQEGDFAGFIECMTRLMFTQREAIEHLESRPDKFDETKRNDLRRVFAIARELEEIRFNYIKRIKTGQSVG